MNCVAGTLPWANGEHGVPLQLASGSGKTRPSAVYSPSLSAVGVAAAGAANTSAHSQATAIAPRAIPPMRAVPAKVRSTFKQPRRRSAPRLWADTPFGGAWTMVAILSFDDSVPIEPSGG